MSDVKTTEILETGGCFCGREREHRAARKLDLALRLAVSTDADHWACECADLTWLELELERPDDARPHPGKAVAAILALSLGGWAALGLLVWLLR